jgi:hypothetical protein
MNKIGLAKDDYSGLEQYYIQKVLKIVENLNQSYIIWQDPIDHGAKVNLYTLSQFPLLRRIMTKITHFCIKYYL